MRSPIRASSLATALGLCVLLLASPALHAQAGVAVAESVTVVPGPRYGAGWFHRFFLGTRYRDLWTTPLRVPVLDLARYAGGLTPLRKGGGQQTTSLRLRGEDGQQYSFRSVDKDPSAILPEDLRATVAGSLLRDQISAGHPAGALVAAPLLDAVGILHATPIMVVMPDSPRLGEFRTEFAGLLGTIELRPDDPDEGNAGFAGALEVVSTEVMLRKTESDPAVRVDARVFLEARLMDIFLGDWDRHRDQWRWALLEQNGVQRYHPVPRDRDQAFAMYDGLVLDLVRITFPQLLEFGPKYAAPLGATWNGRDLDRRLLTELTGSVFDSIAAVLQAQLTVEVLDRAVAALPPEFPETHRADLAKSLRLRREGLPAVAALYYRMLATEVDVHATDARDEAIIERVDNRYVDVRITSNGNSTPWYQRRFDAQETREIRVFLHGNDDRGVVRGSGTAGVTARFIGGGGSDQFVDEAGLRRARFYDDRGNNSAEGGSINRRPYVTVADSNPAIVAPRDWGRRSRNYFLLSAQPDIGFFLSVNPSWVRYGFRKQPYASKIGLSLGYASSARTFNAEVTGDFRAENSMVSWGFVARGSGVDLLRWHGLGNESVADSATRFYRVTRHATSFSPKLALALARNVRLAFGPIVSFAVTNVEDGRNAARFIGTDRPYGIDDFGQFGGEAEFEVDRRNRPVAAGKGVYLRLAGDAYPEVFGAVEDRGGFGSVEGDLAVYMSPPREQIVLALRVGARKVFGDFPFHEAAFLGGANARGYRINRFAGDAAAYGNAELRLAFGRANIIVPGEIGIFGLGDIGRVWLDGDVSDIWHGSAGGGLWFAPLSRSNTVSASVATGSRGEGLRFYLKAGFGY